MGLQSYKAKVKYAKEVADQVLEIECELVEPQTIEFKAGQFVMLKVPNDEGKVVKRAYSICNPPRENGHVMFVIKLLPDGKASNYVREFEGGEEIEFEGPLGHFSLVNDHDKEMLFVGTGTGVAPLCSMIMENLQSGENHKMKLIFGVRHQKDMIWDQEFQKLADKYENFEYLPTLSQPDDGWTGAAGRVTARIPELECDPENTQAYLCGSFPMVQEVEGMLKEKGLPAEMIKKEIY